MSICIVLMPYLPDNVCFKLLGFLENSHSCTNPATNFYVSQQGRIQDFGNGV